MQVLRRWLDRVSRAIVRPLAFVSKEFLQIWRQPRLILTLIVGPFLVLLLFGLGYNADPQPIDTVLVLPRDANMSDDAAAYQDQFSPPFRLAGVTEDRERAADELARREIDAVLIFPAQAYDTIRGGEQAEMVLLYNELDPLQRTWLEYYGYVQTSEFNRQILEQVLDRSRLQATSGSEEVGAAALASAASDIPPHVLVSPFRSEARNLAPSSPDFVAFYAPGVLALLIQHVAVTLTALALVRERLIGAVELFRVGPLSVREILGGKYLSYFVQTGALTAILLGVLVFGLNIPLLGTVGNIALALALLVAASLGMGFFISAISWTETQAVQFALLLLLAAVFFSGFFLPLANLLEPVRVVSYALPVTYGIIWLQEVMLRGDAPPLWVPAALAGMAVGFLVLAWFFFHRTMARR